MSYNNGIRPLKQFIIDVPVQDGTEFEGEFTLGISKESLDSLKEYIDDQDLITLELAENYTDNRMEGVAMLGDIKDGLLEIYFNGEKVGEFSANQASNAQIALTETQPDWQATEGKALILNKPTIPARTSQLTNDSGFITEASIPSKTSELINDSGFIDKNANNLTNYTLKTQTATGVNLGINTTTYVLTVQLKNANGTIIDTKTVDLPIENMFVNCRYEKANSSLWFTPQKGSELRVQLPPLPECNQTANGTYHLQCVVANGTKTYSWVAD